MRRCAIAYTPCTHASHNGGREKNRECLTDAECPHTVAEVRKKKEALAIYDIDTLTGGGR